MCIGRKIPVYQGGEVPQSVPYDQGPRSIANGLQPARHYYRVMNDAHHDDAGALGTTGNKPGTVCETGFTWVSPIPNSRHNITRLGDAEQDQMPMCNEDT